jgi:hypothetical protein
MADNVTLNAGAGGATLKTDELAGSVHVQAVKLLLGADGVNDGYVESANPLPVTGPLTDTELRASAVPVSAAALPLPAGAATEATLSTLNGKVTAVNTGAVVVSSSALPAGAATAAKQPALGTAGTASADVLTVQGIAAMTPLLVDGSATTQPISAAALPLPAGAATAAAQGTGNTSLSSIDGKLATAQTADYDTGGGTATTQMVGIALPANGGPVAGGTASNPLKVDGSGVTQPVSHAGLTALNGAIAGTEVQVDVVAPLPAGTNNIGDVDVLSCALPTGAATEATLATLKAALAVVALQATASGDTDLIASGTRKLKRVEASNSHATTPLTVGLKVASLNGGATFGKKYLPAVGGMAVWVFPDGYLPITAEVVKVNLSGVGQIEMTAYYE